MKQNIKDYIDNITLGQLSEADNPTQPASEEAFPLTDEEKKLLDLRKSEIKSVLRENGEVNMAGDTTRALASFISAIDTEELMQLALLYTKNLPVEYFLPLTVGDDYEDSVSALVNISASTMLRDKLPSIEAATWGAFLKVFVPTAIGKDIFETMVATMPPELYAEVFKDFVNHLKKMNGND